MTLIDGDAPDTTQAHEAALPGTPVDVDGPVVLYRVEDHVAFVTVNRPTYRNAQNSKVTYALDAAFTEAVNDADVKVIVLGGSGQHFSAGHDIGTPERDHEEEFVRRAVMWWNHTDREGLDSRFARESEVYIGMIRRWREIPKPVVAMVQGACISGGLMLAWSCDFIVASDDAFFADPVAKMGIPGVEWFAHPFAMNPRAAKEFLFTGARFSAQRAEALGMVNHVVPRAELGAKVAELAAQMVDMPTLGLMLSKKAVNQAEEIIGLRNSIDSAFGLHHAAHAHNAEVGRDSLAGLNPKDMAAHNKAAHTHKAHEMKAEEA